MNEGNLLKLANRQGWDALQAEILAEEERMSRVRDQVARVRAEGLDEMETAANVYDEAMDSLASIEATDLDELRSYPTPPGLVRIVMEAVCLLMNGDAGDWESARAFLSYSSATTKKKKHVAKNKKKNKNTKQQHDGNGNDEKEEENPATQAPLLQRLRKYRKESVEDDTVRKLQKYVRAQNFNPQAVQQVSMAARSLCDGSSPWMVSPRFVPRWVARRVSFVRLARVVAMEMALEEKRRDLAAAKRTWRWCRRSGESVGKRHP